MEEGFKTQHTQSLPDRTIGILGATKVGVGAIVGGGIFVLSGTALAHSGSSAILAFLLNAVVAFFTIVSYSELVSVFPESGGAYTVARKVFNVRVAFVVGWVTWFAYIVTSALYALGFAAFFASACARLCNAMGMAYSWTASKEFSVLVTAAAIACYSGLLIRKNSSGGSFSIYGKVIVLLVLVVIGLGFAIFGGEGTPSNFSPFFEGGGGGLLVAMGFTFIALQGFDLIPAIAGEVKEPISTVPRSMMFSLAIALAIYLPLIALIVVLGPVEGQSVTSFGNEHQEEVISYVFGNLLGDLGYWLVTIAAIFSMLSALNANLLVASRIASKMASDHTLPHVFSRLHKTSKTPTIAIYATMLAAIAATLILQDINAAAAAAGFIFLTTFALTHCTAYLARKRGGKGGFAAPFFPLVPIAGAVACIGLALFQVVMVPVAGIIAAIWIGIGVLLYIAHFGSNAEVVDAAREGFDPALLRYRGRSPLILLPIANPKSAKTLATVATLLAPQGYARLMFLSVIGKSSNVPLSDYTDVIKNGLSVALSEGISTQALVTAGKSDKEIVRVATDYECSTVLLGLSSNISNSINYINSLLADLPCDAAVLCANENWEMSSVRSILVPMEGRGDVDGFRAKILASFRRVGSIQVTFCTVLATNSSKREVETTEEKLKNIAKVKAGRRGKQKVIHSDDPVEAIASESANHDLLLLGLSSERGKSSIRDFSEKLLTSTNTPTIVLRSAPSMDYADVYRRLKSSTMGG